MSWLDSLINRYRDLVLGVFKLGVDCCGDDCVLRVLDVSHVRNLGCRVHGLMMDPQQVDELVRRPSIIKSLLDRGITRVISYPCVSRDRVDLMGRLGLRVVNYVTSDDCPLTSDVVTYLDAYRVVDLVRRGVRVYVHLFNPRIVGRSSLDVEAVFEVILDYLKDHNARFYLIIDRL